MHPAAEPVAEPVTEPVAETGSEPEPGPEPHEGRPAGAVPALVATVGRVVSFAVVGALVWVLALTTLPRLGGWQPTVITGRSMEPAIRRGDVIVVRPAPVAALIPGAVVTFVDPNRPDRLITHRVVAVEPDGRLRTKGDNNHDADPALVDPATVRGRAVLRVPFAGAPVVWALDRRWPPLAATVIGLALALRTALHPRPRVARTDRPPTVTARTGT